MTILDLQSHTATAMPSCPQNTVVALGCFDGVHIGHGALLYTAVEKAAHLDASAAVWTFSEHLFKDGEALSDFSDKLSLFRAYGIRYAFLASFNEVKNLDTVDFVHDILIKECHAVGAVCGYNYHFGKNAAGDGATLQAHMRDHGYDAYIVDAVCHNGTPVNSTRIRTCLANGMTERAAEMLGRYYSLSLPVLHGKALGRTLNAPTINQEIPKGMQSPMCGTYATMTEINGVLYPSVTNVGTRPSITRGDDHRVNAETHIIGYDGWLYDATVRVYYRHRLRDEIKFESLDELKAQIARDCIAATSTFDSDKTKYSIQKGARNDNV